MPTNSTTKLAVQALVLIGAIGVMDKDAQALDLKVRAPVEVCALETDCLEDVTLAEAKASNAALEEVRRPCYQAGGRNCTDPLATFGPATFVKNPCRGGAFTVAGNAWQRVAPSEVDALFSQAADGTVRNGRMLVESTTSTPQEQHVASCSVQGVKGVDGPPTDCYTVAIIAKSEAYIRVGPPALEPDEQCYYAAAYENPNGKITISFEVKTGIDAARFSDDLMQVLETKFQLSAAQTVQKDKDGTTRSVTIDTSAPLRQSTILPGNWRESIELDVLMRIDAEHLMSVSATAKPMICHTASGNRSDYRGLDPGETQVYSAAFNTGIKESLLHTCGEVASKDDKTIVCKN